MPEAAHVSPSRIARHAGLTVFDVAGDAPTIQGFRNRRVWRNLFILLSIQVKRKRPFEWEGSAGVGVF
jgi:hypothetical protein